MVRDTHTGIIFGMTVLFGRGASNLFMSRVGNQEGTVRGSE